jgi:hypothetical protein
MFLIYESYVLLSYSHIKRTFILKMPEINQNERKTVKEYSLFLYEKISSCYFSYLE